MSGIIGIDPGSSGSLVYLTDAPPESFKLKDATERDTWEWLQARPADFAVIENVHSMPGQGVASSFKFGRSLGFLRGVLIASGVPFEDVTPQKWQKEMRCLTRGDKNVSKARAQELFPGVKITHANADALLMAEYGRRLLAVRSGI